MDFRQITQPSNGRPAAAPQAPTGPDHKEEKVSHTKTGARNWLQVFNGIMLVSIAILVACIAIALTRGGDSTENNFVDSTKYQAVFLNNGQVYFGHVTNLNADYVRMANIYYLTQASTTGTSSTSSNSNYSLVKLGCQQIHDPFDEMVINRDQITFWENLQNDGKVVTSIKQFQKQNPKGPDCTQVSSQTQASGTNAQGGSSDTTK